MPYNYIYKDHGFRKKPPSSKHLYEKWEPVLPPELCGINRKYLGWQNRRGGKERAVFYETNYSTPILRVTFTKE